MKIIEFIKNNYLLLIIKLLIVILFAAILYNKINRIYDIWHLDFYWITEFKEMIANGQFINSIKSQFRPVLILLIPFIGIFINKKIGWILIISYFYYILSTIAIIFKFEYLNNKPDVFQFITITSIILLIIVTMNNRKISNLTYGIAKSELIAKNIIASVIGMGLTILMVYISQ